jgi:hypothetical protein
MLRHDSSHQTISKPNACTGPTLKGHGIMIIKKEACTCGGYMTPYLQDVSTMFSQEIYLYWKCHFCEYAELQAKKQLKAQ